MEAVGAYRKKQYIAQRPAAPVFPRIETVHCVRMHGGVTVRRRDHCRRRLEASRAMTLTVGWPMQFVRGMFTLASARRAVMSSDSGRLSTRARQLYKNISMLFLFPVKDGKLSTGVN